MFSLVFVILLPAESSNCRRGGYLLFIYQDQGGRQLLTERMLEERWDSEPSEESEIAVDELVVVRISVRGRSVFGVLRPWVNEVGAPQVSMPYSSSAEVPTDAELYDLIVKTAQADLQSNAPSSEFGHLRSSGILAALRTPTGVRHQVRWRNIRFDLITIFAIAITLCCIGYLIKSSTRSRDPDRCPACNYPRAGLPSRVIRCPECGQPFAQTGQLSILGAEVKSAR